MNALARTAIAVAIVFAIATILVTPAWACPSCKAALGSDGGNLMTGIFWSILFMMSMPFVILGTFCGSMYVVVRRARAKQDESAQQQPGIDRDDYESADV